MKLRLFIILLIGYISFYGYTVPKLSDLEELFPIMREFPKCEEEINKLDKKALPWEIVSQSLLQIKNMVEYRNGMKIMYNAIGRITYNSNVYLLYDMTDGYEYEIYMSVYSNIYSYPPTLMIYRSIAGECEIEYFINNGRITLVNHINIAEFPYEKTYVYELDSIFSEIRPGKDSCDNYELEIIYPVIIK